MRIALVCPYSCTVPGGVQTQVLGLARALRSHWDLVVVVAPAEGAGIPEGLDAAALDGAIFAKVGTGIPVSVNGSRAPVSPWPTTIARTRTALRRFAPEVVHVHEPFVPGPSLAALTLGPRPIVATFHRSGADVAYRAFGHILSPCSRRVDAAIAVSEDAAETARACIGQQLGLIAIIPNGVELGRLASIEPWPASGPTVAFVGRHEPRKGLRVLLEAFELLQDSPRLWVMGEGPETERLRNQYGANKRIEWLGRVSDDERAARLAGADVLVAPSLGGESFGVVLLEAMAQGTPVVSTAELGTRSILVPASGALVVPEDRAAFAAAVERILTEPQLREELAQRGRAYARTWSSAVMARRLTELYAALRAAPGAARVAA